MSFTDCPSPDTPRSLTGPDILHRHSINSLLEQQEIINRGFVSPSEGKYIFLFLIKKENFIFLLFSRGTDFVLFLFKFHLIWL